DTAMPPQWSRANPVDIVGDAPARRFREATHALLDDPGVDALLVMYSPVAVTPASDAAQAVVEGVALAGTARRKPVIAAWLGDLNPNDTKRFLESKGIANFYTPENAVEAFSYLCAYRRNQAQLLETPAALARTGPQTAPDLAAANAIRDAALAAGRTLLTEDESKALLRAFGLKVPVSIAVTSKEQAAARAREIVFPVALKILSPDITHKSDVGSVRLNLDNESEVSAAFADMTQHVRTLRPDARLQGAVVQPMLHFENAHEVLIGVATDPVFGPVISFGTGGTAVEAVRDTAIALPPLNAALAAELI